MPKVYKEPKPLTKQYIEDFRWAEKHYNELARQYPDQWIAVLKGEVVAAGKDLGEVERVAEQKAEEAGVDQCYYTLIESRPRYYAC